MSVEKRNLIRHTTKKKTDISNIMTLRKVKGNFERLFDKNLTDLVRGIRNNKENEVGLRFMFDVTNRVVWF